MKIPTRALNAVSSGEVLHVDQIVTVERCPGSRPSCMFGHDGHGAYFQVIGIYGSAL